jgi:hypothetical protein
VILRIESGVRAIERRVERQEMHAVERVREGSLERAVKAVNRATKAVNVRDQLGPKPPVECHQVLSIRGALDPREQAA